MFSSDLCVWIGTVYRTEDFASENGQTKMKQLSTMYLTIDPHSCRGSMI